MRRSSSFHPSFFPLASETHQGRRRNSVESSRVFYERRVLGGRKTPRRFGVERNAITVSARKGRVRRWLTQGRGGEADRRLSGRVRRALLYSAPLRPGMRMSSVFPPMRLQLLRSDSSMRRQRCHPRHGRANNTAHSLTRAWQ